MLAHLLGLSGQISRAESSLRCSTPTKTCQHDRCWKVTAESWSSRETETEKAPQTAEGTDVSCFLCSDSN